jgi:hypothetical protein
MQFVKPVNHQRRHSRPRRANSSGLARGARVIDGKPVAVNANLDRLLTDRGWILVERSHAGDVYDWLPSTPIANHEVTYLIVAANHTPDQGPAYRVLLVDGQRLAYDTAACLVADLDGIEGRRCRC